MIIRFKKHISILVICSIVIPQVSFGISSGSVVSDPTNLVPNIGQLVKSTLAVAKDYALDVVAFQLAAMAGSKMSNAIFNNASGGASGDGESQIISSFTDHLQKIDERERKKFITALEVESQNNPFAKDIARKFTIEGQRLGQTGESLVPRFSLPDVAGPNWKNAGTDIKSAGGWNTYIAMALPQNNPYGAEILASEELARKIGLEREAEKLKLLSPGIDSTANSRECGLKFSDYKQSLEKKSGSAQKVTQALNQNSKIMAQIESAKNKMSNLDKNDEMDQMSIGILETEIENLKKQLPPDSDMKVVRDSMRIEGDLTNECIEQLITNPVSTASTLLDSAATYAIDKSKDSKGFADVFLSLFMTMAQSFIRGGLSSWRNGSGGYSTTLRSNLTLAGPEDQVDEKGQIRPINEQPFQVVDLVNDFPYAYELTKQDITKTTESIVELRRSPQLLAELDICIPGPDYKYLERFEKYFQEKLQIPYGVYSRAEEGWERAREEAKIRDLEYSKRLVVSEMKSITNDPVYNIPGATIFKSAVSEFSNKKVSFDQARRSLVEKNSALSGILSVGQQIKTVLSKIAVREQGFIFANSSNMSIDKIVISSRDWGEHINTNTKKVPTETFTGANKEQLVKWAMCMEITEQKWKELNNQKIESAKLGSTTVFTKTQEFQLEKYRSCYSR